MYYLMLSPNDFNLNYRAKPDTLELPVFSELLAQTLNTGKFFAETADKLVFANSIGAKISKFIQIDKIESNESSLLSEPTNFNTGNNDSEIFSAHNLKFVRFPDYLPQELEIYINRLIVLTNEYKSKFNELKNKFTIEEFNFLKTQTLNTFSDNSIDNLRLNLREELKKRDNEDNDNLRLRSLFERFDNRELLKLGKRIIATAEIISALDFANYNDARLTNEIIFDTMTEAGRILIAGKSDNIHKNSDCFILIDLGGDDLYKNLIARSDENKLVSLYFDFGGNDNYISSVNFDISSTVFGVSYLFDKSGADRYSGLNNSVASAYFGIAAIDDQSGADFYQCNLYGLGAAVFGIAILQDLGGNDIYNGGAYCQGFGSVKGYGLVCDYSGNDCYLSGNQIIDSIRYYSNSITMSQGCGFGIRPYIPGGCGLLIDKEGNDLYKSDVFGQATSYWQALAGLIDYSGDDKYISHRYSQAGAVHFGISGLLDYAGNDEYSSYEVSQGCAHDISFALLYDKTGDDYYKLFALGQGAGVTNAIGVLFDETGNDGYYAIYKCNGYGDMVREREFGSIGIFIDKFGDDKYLNLKNSDIKIKSKYGLFYDK